LRTELTDEALMLRFQRGEVSAFSDLLLRHKTALFNFVLRHVHSAPTAEDILQEAFLRVIQSASGFKHDARFTTWLYAIARNLCVDHLRKSAIRKHDSLDGPSSQPSPGTVAPPADPRPSASAERAMQSAELRDRLIAAVEALPEDQREVFLLRELANLGFKEIATITGTAENTVKSRMRYALEKLQESLVDLTDNDKIQP
jgi:RNA polymerase sigma-70 factor (ECF subfamily)